MREGSNDPQWILGDHLGSTSKMVSYLGSDTGGQWYKAWGEIRLTTGTIPTKYQYTGQYNQVIIGLYYYGARWYDANLSRWTQPDSDVPESQGVQAWDRYAYVNNNPIKYTDPSGHSACDDSKYAEDLCSEKRPPTSEEILKSRGQKSNPWDNLPSSYRVILESDGWNAENYTAEFVSGNAVDVGGTYQDPVVWLVALIGSGKLSPYFILLAKDLMGPALYACADGDCQNELIEAQKGITVLGRFPEYLKVAIDIGGNKFNIPIEAWNKLSPEAQWALNKQFLDAAISRGDTFFLANGFSNAPVGTFFRMELDYLFSMGYTISTYQNYLLPPTP